MRFSLFVEQIVCPYSPGDKRRLRYSLFPLPIADGIMWSLLICEEEDGAVLQSCFLCDVTRDEARARELLRLCVDGTVLPELAQEVLQEIAFS